MFIFLRSLIENPSFNSQIKEYLTTPPSKFGSKFEIGDKEIDKLMKTSLVDRALKLSQFKTELGGGKTITVKSKFLKGIEKLDDANMAGTEESMKCTLILTEGDSAKTLAVSGLSVVGRDYFGVFPLKGKPLNVRDTKRETIMKNKEIEALLKILGLTFGMLTKIPTREKKIELLKSKLRYGRVMIFADQDYDGSHIKGLVLNIFHYLFPEVIEDIPEFIISLVTPIVKVTKGKVTKEFYTMSEYNDWLKKTDQKGWGKPKYYKGLGTSTSKEAKEYFTDFENKKIVYTYSPEEEDINDDGDLYMKNDCDDAMNLAFASDKKNARKDWLNKYDRNNIIEQSEKAIRLTDFINRELIHFSNYACERAIPSICDGLKVSQRKIMYAGIKRNLKKDIKVAQFAGYVSEHAGYHHAEKSLQDCIIGMAQNFVGSNNIEQFVPNGQFGTRLQGGKDAAASRYIWTRMHELSTVLHNSNDNPLLDYRIDDGELIEPKFYVPILPMILINGAVGIGTGFSTNIPPHNPLDMCENILRLMDGKKIKTMKPWFRGFEGEVSFKRVNEYGNHIFVNRGVWERTSPTTVRITELPIGTWTEKYKNFIETLIYDSTADAKNKKKQCLTNYKSNCTETKVDFTLTFRKAVLNDLIDNDMLEVVLKLTDEKNSSYGNMHLYNNKGVLTKYDDVDSILKEFFIIRKCYYIMRREYMLKLIRRELDIYEMKIKFIKEFISGDIVIVEREDDDIYEQLETRGYIKFPKDSKNLDDEDCELTYDYLLNMMIRTLTAKKIAELMKLHENKETEYEELEQKTEFDLWREDIEEFKKVYAKSMKEFQKEMESGGKVESGSKKKIKARKTKKKIKLSL